MLLFQTQTMRTQQTRKNDDLNKVVQAFNDYFIVRRDKYLSQYKKDGTGYTVTTTYDRHRPTTFGNLPLNDTLLKRHIRGKTNENFGIFATQGGYVKAISFDIDFADDKQMARWYTHKLHHVLLEDLALDDSNILINRSGLKGYHIHIFVDSLVHVDKVKKLYNHILRLISVQDDVQLSKPLHKYIEWKGNTSHGIKLPLCRHIVNDVRASFVDNYTLKNIDDTAILDIKKLTLQQFNDTLERLDDYLDVDISSHDKLDDKELITQAKELVDSVKPLPIYQLGHDKEYTIDYFNDLLMSDNAIVEHGTRNNITYMLAIHCKDNYAMTQQTALNTLNEWISRQDTNSYTTPLKTCYKENEATVKGVYERDYHLNIQKKNISVYKSELVTILTATKVDGKPFTIKQKSILFAMLLHSKRYTNDCKQTFYMTYDQLQQTADVAKRALISQTITELADANYIKIIRRNAHHTYDSKLPNVYQLTLDEGKEKDATSAANTSNVKDKTIRIRLQINNKTFSKLIRQQFSRKEMLKLNLSRKTIEYFLN